MTQNQLDSACRMGGKIDIHCICAVYLPSILVKKAVFTCAFYPVDFSISFVQLFFVLINI